MKRKLLLFFAMLCVSVGTWATPTVSTSTWMQNNSAYETQTVASIWIENPGELADALSQVGVDFQYLHLSAFNSSNTTLELSAQDIAALNALDVKTIEMNHVYAPYFEFNNPYVEYITLPYNWTKAQVKAVGETHKTHPNFKACLSTSDTEGSGDATLIAYLNEAGTMHDAIMHSFWDERDYKTLGNGSGDCARLRNLVVMGNFCAKDISRAGEYDENGHYVTHGVADENSTVWNRNTDGGNVYNVNDNPNAVPGALSGCHQIESIDLSDGYVPDKYAADIVVGYCGIQVTNLREVWMPTDSRFKTVPADYLNVNSKYIKQICIPGNIQYIMTRAFAGSGTPINYIWTTGPDATTKYDNGAYFVSGDDVTLKYKVNPDPTDSENIDFAAGDDNSFTYGTITLPPGIRLIERHAFSSSVNVKDVYVLNTIAPECHVDAFNSVLYHANNTVTNDKIKEEDGVKIITRDAYTMSGYQMMAVLHYPRTTRTPQTQRYTDPSRDYNIATGERDGNGNMLYFPTQTEFETAHAQGTYGYLWGAWNTERTWYNNEKTLGTAGGWYGDICGTDGHDTANGQGLANQFYIDNPNEDPDYNKTKNVFYDVTMSDANQPGGYTKPDGLADYWTVDRNGTLLYPQAKYETSNLIYVHDADGDYVKDPTKNTTTVFRDYAGSADDGLERFSLKTAVVTDDQGNPTYESCTNGKYVQDFEWVADDAGTYVKETVQDGYASTNVIVDGVTTYYSDAEGTTAVTPQVGAGMFVESGTENDYSQIDTNSEQPGARSEYYTTSDGGQTYNQTNLQFSGNPVLYYPTGNTSTKYTATTKLKYGITHYYDANGNEVIPTLIPDNPSNGLVYYKDENNVEHETTVFIPGQGNYYVKTKNTWNDDYSLVGNVNDNYPSVNLDGTYYYEDGVEEEYVVAQDFVPGTTYYTENNGSYSEATIQWYMITGGGQNLYYVSGSHPAYISAQGDEYDASTTYYSDKNGAEATTIRLNTQYFIPNYVDEYRTAQTGDEGLPHYDKNYLGTYRPVASTDDANEPRYCIVTVPVLSDTPITYSAQNDFRGWHQFVLAAVAHNSKIPFEPLRSWITDNDWWTICEPYDLRYSDLIKFFGYDRQGFDKKIPYLSKLMYVIRDVENQKITMMFSKNLMEYKEVMAEGEGIVHGTINGTDEGKWTAAELEANPVILHAGVPYLIRPNLVAESGGNFQRQFDIYKNQDPDLYQLLKESQSVSAGKQFQMIYKGEYTVPAFVVGYDAPGAVSEGTTDSKTITNKDGSSFTYTPGTIKYNGKTVNYKVSDDFVYTFVGTFYKSAMPQYSYFLGWDTENNRASFWYSRILDKNGWNWNNETGIILPNFDTTLQIHQASSMNDPARWVFNPDNKVDNVDDYVKCDDFPSGSGVAGAKQFTMDFGATSYNDSEATGIEEVVPATTESETINVYNVNGVFMGNSVKGLAKGIYIVNGKKYVVK